MILASLVQHYREAFEHKYSDAVSPAMRRAMDAVLACRTQHYGKMQLSCPKCLSLAEFFHSCGHRSCPACQHFDSGQWLERQCQKLLPVDYFMVTFTLPSQLQGLAWHHQRMVFGALFEAVASTLKSFALNDKALGGDLGFTAVLHTHSRQLAFHPHVHVIVPAGCFLKNRKQWKKRRGRYLFHELNLAKVFRARFLERLIGAGFRLPGNVPKQWVVHCDRVGSGLPALKYLSRYLYRYLYRGVISERHILHDDGAHVTFEYQDSKSKSRLTRTVKGEDFLWLVFQHVLPKGFRRARDFGFLHGNASKTRQLIQWVLQVKLPQPKPSTRAPFLCAHCKAAMNIVAFIKPGLRSG